MIGGVVVDECGKTAMPGLFACGEAASSGVHGANRLASNSLLEGLVFGTLTGAAAGQAARGMSSSMPARRLCSDVVPSARTMLDLADVRNSLRSVMWRNVGIERTGDRLVDTADILDFWGRYVMDKLFDDRPGWEIQNMLSVARLIAISAAERRESRGVHSRDDYPQTDNRYDGRHLCIRRDAEGCTTAFEPADHSAAPGG
jgi:L-aspartate oxidase